MDYKTTKRGIAMELKDMITAILIIFAGETSIKSLKPKHKKMIEISSDHNYSSEVLFSFEQLLKSEILQSVENTPLLLVKITIFAT